MRNSPTPCCIVLYHFVVANREGISERRSRPAMVTSVGASDNVVNLHVFFEPDDLAYHPPVPTRLGVHAFDPNSTQAPCWSWPGVVDEDWPPRG